MAYDKVVDSTALDAGLLKIAKAIRAKGGTSASLAFPDAMAAAIAAISTGEAVEQATPSITVSTSGLITASATQEAGLVPAGTKSATEQLRTQGAKTVTPSTADQTAVSSGIYTTGTVEVKGDVNLKAENIAEGVSIFGVLGTFAGGGGLPNGFSAINSGSITYDSPQYAPSIPHGLGVVPNFFYVVAEGSVTIANNSGYMIGLFSCKQPFESSAGYYTTISISSAGVNTMSGNVIKEADIDSYFNTETFMPYGFFKAGVTYRWVAGVMDGLG